MIREGDVIIQSALIAVVISYVVIRAAMHLRRARNEK